MINSYQALVPPLEDFTSCKPGRRAAGPPGRRAEAGLPGHQAAGPHHHHRHPPPDHHRRRPRPRSHAPSARVVIASANLQNAQSTSFCFNPGGLPELDIALSRKPVATKVVRDEMEVRHARQAGISINLRSATTCRGEPPAEVKQPTTCHLPSTGA